MAGDDEGWEIVSFAADAVLSDLGVKMMAALSVARPSLADLGGRTSALCKARGGCEGSRRWLLVCLLEGG